MNTDRRLTEYYNIILTEKETVFLVLYYFHDETLTSNYTSTLSENEELIKFKNSLINEFDALKSSIFAEVNSFKNKYLNSYSKDVSINNSERLIKQSQNNINFLRNN